MAGKTLKKNYSDIKVGDLVVVHCKGTTLPWYSGVPGLLIHFDLWGTPDIERGDPVVQYGNRTMRLARSSLELVHAAR